MAVSLTIYNQGTALVRQERTFALRAGENTVDFTDVAATIDRTSVTVKATPDADAVRVLEQSFLYDLVGLGGLLRRYTDSRIAVTTEDGTSFDGTLLTGQADMHHPEPDIILRGDDGQVTVVRHNIRDIRFPQLPDGLRTRPTLRWVLESAADGDHTLLLTYLADGMRWTADYNLLLNATSDAFDLIGWVTLTNESGATFTDAQIKLIAGEVQRIMQEARAMRMEKAGFAGTGGILDVEQREMFEYQLYEISRRVSLENNETKQVEFLQKATIPARLIYETDNEPYFRGYGTRPPIEDYHTSRLDNRQSIAIMLEFSTGEAGVGADMPAGRTRVFQNDIDGAGVLVGEAVIKHTPKGEDLRLTLGKAFDLVCERHERDFRHPAKNELVETIEVRLRNRKETQAVEIRVIERLHRWSNWAIENASHPYEKIDRATIRFPVTVPAQGETVLTYTVRYSWPPEKAE